MRRRLSLVPAHVALAGGDPSALEVEDPPDVLHDRHTALVAFHADPQLDEDGVPTDFREGRILVAEAAEARLEGIPVAREALEADIVAAALERVDERRRP